MQMDWQSVVVWCFEAVMHPKDADGLAKRGSLVFQSCNASERCRWTSKAVEVWCFEAVMHPKDADGLAKRGSLVFQSCNASKRCRWISKAWKFCVSKL